ncbi:MAG TPA: zinc-ribbon domain-containing protein, partial [Candidatus Limnocylindrales bacterium]|nr:zinc-ribbon domain-containing protein [Candidatus Limnocylindrales bacterium]
DAGLPFLGRPAAATGGIEALWAASAQEVAKVAPAAKAAGGVQPCVSCGLSLSANARFCRRCGTPQA